MMKALIVIYVALIGTVAAEDYDDKWTEAELRQIFNQADVDATAPTDEMIANNNYTVEVHTATTDDGYILRMHRIPASPISPPAPGKPLVFLMHGLFSSSADWIETGPGKGLGYILADHGYDVWMGNERGNTYSRHHTTILSDKDFWNFSFHEIGYYDLPAMIDYALATSGQKDLFYIGHSQGTTAFFVMTSQRPRYNEKIESMIALAPIGFMGNIPGAVLKLAAQSTNTLLSILPTFVGHTPAGGSIRQLGHYGQEIQSHRFAQFDHGPVKNLLIYGSLTPPDYDLSLITAPVHLVYGENDLFAAPEDVAELYNKLGNPVELWRVSDKEWSHFDFVWGIDAKTVIYAPLLERLKKKYKH